jgi:hypothetical protein
LNGFNAVPGANPDCSFVSFSTSFGSKLATTNTHLPYQVQLCLHLQRSWSRTGCRHIRLIDQTELRI